MTRATTAMLSMIGWIAAGCATSAPATDDGVAGGGRAGGSGDDGATAGPANGTGTTHATSAATGDNPTGGGTLGIVVIDVQETFVSGAMTADMPGVLSRTQDLFGLATQRDVPFFVTFEDATTGDHALHAPLVGALPPQAQQRVKTTFAATGLPSFADAVRASGATHFVVVGAETDVCVLQTVLGLRSMGFQVLLQEDAIFSEEPRVSPALRRMQQAGVLLVTANEVAAFAADPATLPAPASATVRLTRPLEVGVVLHAFTDAGVAATTDAFQSQKLARLRELLLVAEWFDLPVYVDDVGAGLPDALAQYFEGTLRPVSAIGDDGAVTQLVFAGTSAGIVDAIAAQAPEHDVFVVEDALLGSGTMAEQVAALGPSFDAGLVPTTYKSFYYDMTRSVDTGEWPSQTWVSRFDPYYDLTQAPEDLPPLPAD